MGAGEENEVIDVGNYLDFLALFGIGGAHPGGLHLTKKVLQSENLNSNSVVLDVGCGTGQTAAHLKQKYHCHITGIDKHHIMVEKAKKRCKSLGLDIDIKMMDVENLSFPSDHFDIILSESVLVFTKMEESIREMAKVLKKGGILVAIEMTNEGFLSNEEKDELKNFYGISEILSEEEWKQFFQRGGFKEVSIFTEQSFTDGNDSDEVIGTEFQLSTQIDQQYMDVFELHEYYTVKYKNKLGYRIYKCRL